MRSLENEREGRIRPAAAGPRRLRVSTGHSLRAAFRIHPPNTNTTKKTSSNELVFFVVGEDGFARLRPDHGGGECPLDTR